MKRLFDLLLAILLIGVCTLPAGVIALLVKLSSPGPAIFRQRRVGRYGIPFTLLKFRTMRPIAGGPGVTVAGDQRITSVGRWLRRWKLDELPQLINIFCGEMSFVGPRPELPEYVALYPPECLRVLSVRPGLTDWATLKYRDEERLLAAQPDPLRYYREIVLPDKLRLSLSYVEQCNLRSDLKILCQTLIRLAGLKELRWI